MNKGTLRRTGIYALVTFVIIVVWFLVRLSYGYSVPPPWIFYIIYNIGLIFNPLRGGPLVLALVSGIAFIFFTISVIGETITVFRQRRNANDPER